MSSMIQPFALKLKLAAASLAALLIAFSLNCAGQSNRKALIVAISDYADPGDLPSVTTKTKGFPDLNSMNDVPLIKAALLSQGFTEEDIMVVEDGAATKAGIVKAIRTHLINKVGAGDIAVFHFSGHGQQVLDDNGDENDGLDEALVPYDAAPAWQPKVNEAQYHLRDDEIGELVDELRIKLGENGHVLTILDACSSGTATRGFGTSRGYSDPLVPEGTAQIVGKEDPIGRGLSIERRQAGEVEKSGLAPFVLISAALADQLNYEAYDEQGKSVGSLSYAVSRVMTQGLEGSSYLEFFNRLLIEMSSLAPNQTPCIEGDVDQLVLRGEAKAPLAFFSPKEFVNDRRMKINGGRLYGLLNGSRVKLYPIGSDTSLVEPIASGVVIKADNLDATVELTKPTAKNTVLNSSVYVTQRGYGPLKVRVQLDIEQKPKFKARFEKAIAELELVEVVTEAPDVVIELNNSHARKRGPNQLIVTSRQDHVLVERDVEKADLDEVIDKVIQEQVLATARANFLRGLSAVAEGQNVSLKFLREGEQADNPVDGAFKVGERFKISLTNNGDSKVYVALLDIMPDNNVGIMIPHPNESKTAADYMLKPGQTIEVRSAYTVAPPVGRDILKLVVTDEPVDFSNLIQSNGASYRGTGSESRLFESLAMSYPESSSRSRGAVGAGPTSSESIFTFFLDIIR